MLSNNAWKAELLEREDIKPQQKDEWIESSILGAAMLDEGSWQKIARLNPEDFSIRKHSLVFSAMLLCSEANRLPDLLSVIRAMPNDELAEAGGIPYLSQLSDHSHRITENDVRQLKDAAEKRRVAKASKEIHELAKSDISPAELRKQSSEILDDTAIEDDEIDRSLAAATAKTFAMLEDIINRKCVPLITGMKTVDEMCAFFGKQLVVIGARPSVGKTALLLQWIRSFCENGSRGYFASVELPEEDIPIRFQSHITGLGKKDIVNIEARKSHEIDAIGSNMANIARDWDLIIDGDFRHATIDDLVARVEAEHRKKPLDFVGIDYLQKVQCPKSVDPKDDNAKGAYISNACMNLTKSIGVPVFLVSQLNRNLEKRRDPIPQMSDLRDSGSIEQDAEIIIFPHRQRCEKGLLEDSGMLQCPKNRNGEQFSVDYEFNGKKQWCEER